jgi:hypothetical protein
MDAGHGAAGASGGCCVSDSVQEQRTARCLGACERVSSFSAANMYTVEDINTHLAATLTPYMCSMSPSMCPLCLAGMPTTTPPGCSSKRTRSCGPGEGAVLLQLGSAQPLATVSHSCSHLCWCLPLEGRSEISPSPSFHSEPFPIPLC